MRFEETLEDLVQMSRMLGLPEWECVVAGEGNTSARADRDTFWVKASGMQLATIKPDGFVRVKLQTLLDFLNSADSSDEVVTAALGAATVQPEGLRPSVETVMHAYLLSLPEIRFVAHTHPTPVNALLCSQRAEELAQGGRLFPEEVALCGEVPCWVPYTDPGIALARQLRTSIEDFVEQWGIIPRQILIQNHGLVVPGSTAAQATIVTQITVKAARILLGTTAFGGPHFLPAKEAERIATRRDEEVRRQKMGWS